MWPMMSNDLPIFGMYPRLSLFPNQPTVNPPASAHPPLILPPPPTPLPQQQPPSTTYGPLASLEMSLLFARCLSNPAMASPTSPPHSSLIIPSPCSNKLELAMDWRTNLPYALLPPPSTANQLPPISPCDLGPGYQKLLAGGVREKEVFGSPLCFSGRVPQLDQSGGGCASGGGGGGGGGVKRCKKISATPSHNSNEHIEDIRRFARAFKMKRLSLGLTQTQIGRALSTGVAEGPTYSQSAICRFEKLDITPKSAQRIKPVLERWLADLEGNRQRDCPTFPLERPGAGNEECDGNSNNEVEEEASDCEENPALYDCSLEDHSRAAAALRKRKSRTNFSVDALDRLNHEFGLNTHPSGARISQLANQLNYDREVVRVWFCNKRQAFRNNATNPLIVRQPTGRCDDPGVASGDSVAGRRGCDDDCGDDGDDEMLPMDLSQKRCEKAHFSV